MQFEKYYYENPNKYPSPVTNVSLTYIKKYVEKFCNIVDLNPKKQTDLVWETVLYSALCRAYTNETWININANINGTLGYIKSSYAKRFKSMKKESDRCWKLYLHFEEFYNNDPMYFASEFEESITKVYKLQDSLHTVINTIREENQRLNRENQKLIEQNNILNEENIKVNRDLESIMPSNKKELKKIIISYLGLSPDKKLKFENQNNKLLKQL